MKAKIVERFNKFVMPVPMSGCWIWMGFISPFGYGQITINSKTHQAHRISYSTFKGDIPTGMCVCHHCDVPSCVNPDHLFLGTHKENTQDMIKKGRRYTAIGENHVGFKLSDNDVRDIRLMYATKNYTQSQIASDYDVDQSTISYIISGKHRKHVHS